MLIKKSIYSRTLVLFICIFLAQPAAARIIYVDAGATGADDSSGLSWANAYDSLKKALDEASSGDKIRVAQGVYRPAGLNGDREETFKLKNNVAIRGGYAGFGEPDPDARDIDGYRTILSGDLNGDDGPNFANNSENSFHVVNGSGTDKSSELNGFTITGGDANGVRPRNLHGGGMYNDAGSPKIIDCTFSGNYTENNGGGMYNEAGNPILTGCTFTGNSADEGGGMYNVDAYPVLTNCIFIDNSAMNGGGMYNNENSDSELFSCPFVGNRATYDGGGIFNNVSDANLTNCIFSGNSAG